jgi:hypothetical protein
MIKSAGINLFRKFMDYRTQGLGFGNWGCQPVKIIPNCHPTLARTLQ